MNFRTKRLLYLHPDNIPTSLEYLSKCMDIAWCTLTEKLQVSHTFNMRFVLIRLSEDIDAATSASNEGYSELNRTHATKILANINKNLDL